MESFVKAVVNGTRSYIASWPLGDTSEINKYYMNYSGNINETPLNITVDTMKDEIQSDVGWSPKLFFRLTI